MPPYKITRLIENMGQPSPGRASLTLVNRGQPWLTAVLTAKVRHGNKKQEKSSFEIEL